MIGIFRLKPTKSAQKAGSDGVKEMYSVYNDQVKDVIKIKDGQIQRLMAKIRELDPIIDDNSSKEPISLESLRPILEERGINPAILTNPFVMKYIKKYTKGMGLDEILALAEQFGLFKGNKQPQGEISQSGSVAWDPNSA